MTMKVGTGSWRSCDWCRMTMTAHTIMIATGHADREHQEHHADHENPKHHDDHDQDREAHEAALGDSAHEAHGHGSGETVGIVAV